MDYKQAITIIENATAMIEANRQDHRIILQAIEKIKELIPAEPAEQPKEEPKKETKEEPKK